MITPTFCATFAKSGNKACLIGIVLFHDRHFLLLLEEENLDSALGTQITRQLPIDPIGICPVCLQAPLVTNRADNQQQ